MMQFAGVAFEVIEWTTNQLVLHAASEAQVSCVRLRIRSPPVREGALNNRTGLTLMGALPDGRASDSSRMRILQICSAREIGGGERHLADLANTLAQRGHQVFVALSPSSPARATLSSVPAENIIELPMRNSLNL